MATIVIKPTNRLLHFSQEIALPWSATNLGEGNFLFRAREEVYWKAEMKDYDRASGGLTLRVIDYEADPSEYQASRPNKAAVARVVFQSLDRDKFCAQLSYYRAGELPLTAAASTAGESPAHRSAGSRFADRPVEQETASGEYPLNFSLPLTELTLHDGYAEGSYDHPTEPLPLRFRIANRHLMRSFHPIRAYFARHLRRKTIEVTATLLFNEAGDPEIRQASSPQIARIDDRTIEVLRTRTLRDFIRSEETDRRLFTPEDLMANYAQDDPVHALLPPEGTDLLAEILRTQEVRNARQLAYLAGRQEPRQKLRFVLSPQFGFVFFLRGEGLNHFLLELLDSHATYVWSIPHDTGTLADHYERVTFEVQQLTVLGRQGYRRTNTFADTFWTVRHENVGSELVDGFPRWKYNIEEGLV